MCKQIETFFSLFAGYRMPNGIMDARITSYGAPYELWDIGRLKRLKAIGEKREYERIIAPLFPTSFNKFCI